ncbi:MAG: hypothetical protein ABFS35_21585 [Bacteroidota bacterium]
MPIFGTIAVTGATTGRDINSAIELELDYTGSGNLAAVFWSVYGSPTGSTFSFNSIDSNPTYFQGDTEGTYNIQCEWFADNGDEGTAVVSLGLIATGGSTITQTHSLVEMVGIDKCTFVGVRVQSNEPFDEINGNAITSTQDYTINKFRGDDNLNITIKATGDHTNENSKVSTETAPIFSSEQAYGTILYLDVTMSAPVGLNLTYDYGEGGGFVSNNKYHYTTAGLKTITLKDEYGCERTVQLTAVAEPSINLNDYPSNFYISKANSIRFVKQETIDGCEVYKNDENTFGCEVPYKDINYDYKQMFKKCNDIQNQFKSSFDTHQVFVYNALTDALVDTPAITKVQTNIGVTDSREYNYTEDSIYTYLYFDNGQVPSFYEIGGAVTIDLETHNILGIDYLSDLDVYAIKTLKFTSYGSTEMEYTYNKHNFDVYEFDFDMSAVVLGEFYITIRSERTTAYNPDDNFVENWKSLPIVLGYSFPQTVDIAYFNNKNNDIYWQSGIIGRLTIGIDYRIGVGKVENTVVETDSSSYLKDSIGTERFKFLFEPQTLEISRKLIAALSQYYVAINGVLYNFDSIEPKSIGEYTNDYVIEAEGIKLNINAKFISDPNYFDWSSGVVKFDSSITFDRETY